MSHLLKSIERLLERASKEVADTEATDWLDVLLALQGAQGVVKGNGPGGDL